MNILIDIGVDFVQVICSHVFPSIVWKVGCGYWHRRFLFIEQYLHEHVLVVDVLVVEDELNIARHWENLIVLPSVLRQFRRVHGLAISIKIE